MKITIMIMFGILLMLVTGLVSAHEHNVEEVKELIDSGISCNELTDEQLESMGEYYMEQMHPGEAHKLMDQMMGGEDSESLKQMHIQMAKVLYCGESGGMMSSGGGMMGMMNMMGGGNNMMDSGSMMGNNMMGSSWGLWNIIGILFWIALLVVLILLIIWLYKKIIGKTVENGSVLEILKKRFVRGEITKKEFESMKKEVR